MVARVVRTSRCFVIMSMSLSWMCMGQTLDWAPVGAKWYFEETYFMSADIGYVVIESVKDTVINNRNCKMLVANKYACYIAPPTDVSGCYPYPDTIFYTYESNDTVYFYNPLVNDFRLVYVNNKNIGDSIIINWEMQRYNMPDTVCRFKYVIDSIKYISMNSVILRITYLHEEGGILARYIENMSFHNPPYYMGLTLIYYKCPATIVDGTFYSFRCYYHPTYGLFKFSSVDCDYTYTSSFTQLETENTDIYYSNEYLFVNLPQRYFPVVVRVSDALGKEYAKLKIENPDESKIYLDIPSGKFYILQIISDNSDYRTNMKIIK